MLNLAKDRNCRYTGGRSFMELHSIAIDEFK